jgi:hypothetical protein
MFPFLFLVIYFVFQFIVFFKFYLRREGKKAIYRAWYANIIDIFAMLSGLIIMTLATITIYNTWIFNVYIPVIVFYTFFILGSWQFSIHCIKMLLRHRRWLPKHFIN